MKYLKKSGEREYFDKIADIFDTRLNVYTKLSGALRIKRRLALFLNKCLTYGLNVLEAGCGTGEYTKGLLKNNCRLVCADISYNMIQKAKEKNKNAQNLYFVVSDIEQLPFKDEVFDAVVGNSILHHLANISEAARQIRRVLKDCGSFAFSEPNMLNPQVFLQKSIGVIKRLSGDTPSEGAFFRWQIKNIFKAAGFKNIKVEPFDFLHPFCPNIFARLMDMISQGLLEKAFLIKEIAGSLLVSGKK